MNKLAPLRIGRKVTSAFASRPLTPPLSPEYRGEGVIFRPCLTFAALLLTLLAVLHAADAMAPSAGFITPRPTAAKPLLLGNWADPSILQNGSDYYLTHSSFEFQPGLLVWHSKDLRTWRPLARAVTNQSGSIWAPDLIKHDGKFYIFPFLHLPAARMMEQS
ncbi:MAG: family 43 glycosylhydrolase [Planctomycetota bacterium]|nr:family 43 glycosylhydrolase [Planctomycetota bacterium]